jgi:hypothetical protein
MIAVHGPILPVIVMNRDETTWLAIGFHHSLAVPQFTLGAVKTCFTLNELHCFSA